MSKKIRIIEQVLALHGYDCIADPALFQTSFSKVASSMGFSDEQIAQFNAKIPEGITPENLKSLIERNGIDSGISLLADESLSGGFLSKLNYLPIFNPSLLPHREVISRVSLILVVCAFVFLKFWKFSLFPQGITSLENLMEQSRGYVSYWALMKSLWVLETLILLGYILACLTRDNAKNVAKGFMQVIYPFIIAGIPVLISFTKFKHVGFFLKESPRCSSFLKSIGIDTTSSDFFLIVLVVLSSLMVFGAVINFVGLLYLRRSFTLMADARTLIQGGPFRFVRHPLYAAHFVLFLGSTLLRFHWITLSMYFVFFVGQVYRARIEERKLSSVFLEYGLYKRKTGMFFPKLFRFGS